MVKSERWQVLIFSGYAQVAAGRFALDAVSSASALCAELAARIPSVGSEPAVRALRDVLVRTVCGLERSAKRDLTASQLGIYIVGITAAADDDELRRAFDAYMRSWGPTPAQNPSRVSARIEQALRMIKDRFSDPTLCVEQVASRVGLSRWHFERLFRRVTGHCFKHELRRVRLRAAIHLLENSVLSVKEITAQTGYSHASDFNRQFRQQQRSTPTQWRRDAELRHRARCSAPPGQGAHDQNLNR
jgi:AraC-like DNA-binding protein